MCVLKCVTVFICMCVSMCESWFYKYEVLMVADKLLKEKRGREEEQGEREKGRSHFATKWRKKCRLRIFVPSSISLQSNYTAHRPPSLSINEIHAKS